MAGCRLHLGLLVIIRGAAHTRKDDVPLDLARVVQPFLSADPHREERAAMAEESDPLP